MAEIVSHTPVWVFGLLAVLLAFVPGSWMPLLVIMAIFFARHACAVMHALDVGLVSTPGFVLALSALYGLLSGDFAARALNLVTLAKARR